MIGRKTYILVIVVIFLVSGLSGCTDSDVRRIGESREEPEEVKVTVLGDTDVIELVDYKVYTKYYNDEVHKYFWEEGFIIEVGTPENRSSLDWPETGDKKIVGTVKNIGNEPIFRIGIHFTLYDINDWPHQIYTVAGTTEPGETSDFIMETDTNMIIKELEIRLESE